jgi:hypothetical protein
MAEPARKLDSTKSSAPTFNWEDPLDLESQLTEEERMIRDSVRAYADDKLMPRVLMSFRKKASIARSSTRRENWGCWG